MSTKIVDIKATIGKKMKAIVDYLDDLKGKTGSDYATAKALKITKESVSKIRSRGQMSDETALKIADLLGVNRSEVLMAATIARSNGEVKKEWINFSRMCGYGLILMISSWNIGAIIYIMRSVSRQSKISHN